VFWCYLLYNIEGNVINGNHILSYSFIKCDKLIFLLTIWVSYVTFIKCLLYALLHSLNTLRSFWSNSFPPPCASFWKKFCFLPSKTCILLSWRLVLYLPVGLWISVEWLSGNTVLHFSFLSVWPIQRHSHLDLGIHGVLVGRFHLMLCFNIQQNFEYSTKFITSYTCKTVPRLVNLDNLGKYHLVI
jgi:hypothetical protein